MSSSRINTASRRCARLRARTPLLAGLLVAVLVAGSAPSSAGAATPLSVLPGPGGCLVAAELTGCTVGAPLQGAADVALAADGRLAYVAAPGADAVAVLRRDPASGTVATLRCVSQTGADGCSSAAALSGARAVALSPDGRFLAVAAPGADGVTIFLRDGQSGVLTPASCATETGAGGCLDGRALRGARDVAFTLDGKRLLVAAPASDALASLTVDPSTGALGQAATSRGCISETGTGGLCADGRALLGAKAVAAANGGALVAAPGSDALARLSIDASTGVITQNPTTQGCISDTGTAAQCADGRALLGAGAVAVSPDGGTAYVAASGSHAVSAVALGATLTQATAGGGCVSGGGSGGSCLAAHALLQPTAIAVAADGRSLYVAAAGSDAVTVLDRTAGRFGQASDTSSCLGAASSCAPARGLVSPQSIVLAGDGRALVAAATPGAVLALQPAHAPVCRAATTSTPWDTVLAAPLACTDPDGDPLTFQVLSSTGPATATLGADGVSAQVTPKGTAGTVKVSFVAGDGTFRTTAQTLTVQLTQPPPPPPPGLPASLTMPLLGIERTMLDPRSGALVLRTFCLPRAASACSGTVQLSGAGQQWAPSAPQGGQVAVSLDAQSRAALLRAGRIDAVAQLSEQSAIASGWRASTAGPAATVVSLPVSRRRAGTRRKGGNRADRMAGGPRDDHLSGAGGNDRLFGRGGDDRLMAGGGNDRADGGNGQDDGQGGFGNDRLLGGAGDDRLDGGSGDDVLGGGLGDDTMVGNTGDDAIEGGAGDDALDGWDGDDTIRGGSGNDYVVESRFGDDRLLDGGPGDDYVDGNRGNDQDVRGGEGDDIVLGGAGSDSLDGGPGNDLVAGGDGADPRVRGGDGDDTVVGGRGNDELIGGAGSDVLYGSTGFDTLNCGAGEDWAFTDSPTEARKAVGCEHILGEDPSRDNVYDPTALVANRGLARGGSAALRRGSALGDAGDPGRPRGTAGNDELTGTESRDHLNGNDGDDLVAGLGGDDDLDGGDGDDEIRGGAGNDRLFGRFDDDMIVGDDGNDELEGGRGQDTLEGGAGNDRLNGGFDPDVIRAGTGNDRVIAVGGGTDQIDCGPGNDVADVDKSDVTRGCESVRRH